MKILGTYSKPHKSASGTNYDKALSEVKADKSKILTKLKK